MERSVQAVYIDRDSYHGKGDDTKIPVKLLAFDSSFEPSKEDQVIKVKVYTKKDHEHTDDDFKIFIVIVSYTGTVVGETTGACSSEYIYETVK